MMTCFDIHNFSQLVHHASIYEESLKENAAALVEQRKRTFIHGVSSGRAGPSKSVAIGSQPF
jgi:hypothetical protein